MVTNDVLYNVIAKVMDVPVSEINDDSGPENIETWDSFNGLLLLDELESEFKVKFSLDEVSDVKTVKDIKKHLQDQGITVG